MYNYISNIKMLIKDKEGVTTIEYALLGSLLAVVIVLAVTTTGEAVLSLYQSVADVFS